MADGESGDLRGDSQDLFGDRGSCLATLDVLILAGGLGTRIRPVLGDVPKVLAPIGGRPCLAHLLDLLRRFGAHRIVLGLGHAAQPVVDYLAADPPRDLTVVTVIEPEPRGTAGAIRFAAAELRSDPVLVMNGDSFVDADLCALVGRYRQTECLGTILCAQVDDAGRFGQVALEPDGRIRSFAEKNPAAEGPAFVNAGTYVLSRALINAIVAGNARSLERDVFERLPARSLTAFAGRFAFIDIGTPESLMRAAEALDEFTVRTETPSDRPRRA